MAYTLYTDIKAKSISYGSTRSSASIKYIVIHYTSNKTDTAINNAKYFRDTNTRSAGAHYFVDSSSVYQSIDDLFIAYAVGGNKYSSCSISGGGTMYGIITNSNSISIEMCSNSSNITNETIENTVALTKLLMAKYNIPISNVYRHFDVNGKCCPSSLYTGSYDVSDKWIGINPTSWKNFKAKLITTPTQPVVTEPKVEPYVAMTQQQFIETVAKYAQEILPKYGFKVVSPLIGQCCKESGFGTSDKVVNNGKPMHNYLGIKYNTPQRVPISIGAFNANTKEEYVVGQLTPTDATWYRFASLRDCIEGYCQFLKNAPGNRYAALFTETNPETYCHLLKSCGYATGANYDNSLWKDYVVKYSLTKYDSSTSSSSTPSTTQKYYRVQLGAYGVKSNAEVQLAKVKAAGFNAIIKQVDNLYKIQLGAYSNKANAEAMAKQAQAKGFNTYIAYN